jgi:WD40 repeat protein
MSLNIPCARCNRRLALPPSVVGRLVQCPACRGTFTAEEPRGEEPILDAVLVPAQAVPTLQPVEEPELADEPDRRRPRNSWQRSQESRDRRGRQAPPPPRRRARKALSFTAFIRSDSKGELSGRHTAQVTDKGLRLFQHRDDGLLIPPGGPAEYTGGNRLVITYDGRRLEVDVSCGFGPRKKLAEDLAAYLRGDLPALEPYRYRVPLVLLILAILPLTMPAVLFGKVIWMATGVGLSLLCLLIAFICRWSTDLRLGLILTGGIGGCVAAVVGFVYFLIWGPINPGDWKTFYPPNVRCKILMPGTPVAKTPPAPGGAQVVIHAVENRIRDYAFIFAAEPIRDGLDMPLDQRFDAVRGGILQGISQHMPGATLVNQRTINQEGFPGREYVIGFRNQVKIVYRVFVIEDSLYMLGGGGRGYETNDPDLVKFFNSFEFTEDPKTWTPKPAIVNAIENPPPDGVRNTAWISQRLASRANHQVYAAAYSPDGDHLAVGEGDHYAYHHLVVWEPAKNRVVNSFLNQSPLRSVQSVAFSPDGKFLAGGTGDGEVHVFDWPAGTEHRVLRGHNQPITGMVFSPDSKTLVSASLDSLRFWDVATGQETGQDVRWRFGNPAVRASLVFRPDGKFLVTGGNGREILFRDPRTGQVRFRKEYPHIFGAAVLAFSPDGKLLLGAGQDGNVMPFTEDGEPIQSSDRNFPQVRRHSPIVSLPGAAVRQLAFRKDGLLAVGGDNLIALVDPAGRKIIQQLNPGRRFSTICFQSDGQQLAAASLDGETILYDVSRIDKPGEFVDKPQSNRLAIAGRDILSFALAPDDNTAATLDSKGEVHLWDIKEGKSRMILNNQSTGSPGVLSFDRANRYLYVSNANRLQVWNLPTNALLPVTTPLGKRFALSPEGDRFVMADEKGLALYDPRTGQAVGAPGERLPGIAPFAFGPNGLLATGSSAYSLAIWDAALKPAGVLENHRDFVNVLAFVDARFLVSCGNDLTIRYWNLASASEIWSRPLTSKPLCLTVTSDQRLVAVGTETGKVHFFELNQGVVRGQLQASTNAIRNVAFSSNGKALYVAAKEGVTVWDAEQVLGPAEFVPPPRPERDRALLDQVRRVGRAEFPLPLLMEHAAGLAISPDGQRLAATARNDLSLRIWDLRTGQPLTTRTGIHPGGLRPPVFSPDGRWLATTGNDGVIRLRDPRIGTVLHTLQLPQQKDDPDGARSLVFSPGGQLLLVPLAGGGKVFDLTGPVPVEKKVVFPESPVAAVVSVDGKEIAFPAAANSLRFPKPAWELIATQLVSLRPGELACSAQGTLAAWLHNNTLEVIDVKTGEVAGTIATPDRAKLELVGMSPDGKWIATTEKDKLQLWDTATRMSKAQVGLLNNRTSASLPFSGDGKLIALQRDGAIVLVNVENPTGSGVPPVEVGNQPLQPSSTVKIGTGTVRSLVFSPDGKYLAATWTRNEMGKTLMMLAMWESNGKKVPISLNAGVVLMPGGLTFSEDGKRLYLLGKPDILVWDATGGKPSATIHVPDDKILGVTTLSVSPDGKWLAMKRARDVVVLPVEKPEDAKVIEPNALLRTVGFGPKEGQVSILTESESYSHLIYDVATGKQVDRRVGPGRGTGRLMFANGRAIVIAGTDRSLTIWDGDRTTTFPMNTLGALGSRAALSADGKRVAVAEVDGHVTLLDLTTQKKLNRVRLHGGLITALVWTPDGKGLLTSNTADAEIRRWDVAKLEKPAK